jgi:hypothetical protein
MYNVLLEKPAGKRPLGRRRSRWENGIRMYLRELVWEGVEWIYQAQNRNRWLNILTIDKPSILAPRNF